MEPEGTLHSLQQHATGTYPYSDEASSLQSCFFKI